VEKTAHFANNGECNNNGKIAQNENCVSKDQYYNSGENLPPKVTDSSCTMSAARDPRQNDVEDQNFSIYNHIKKRKRTKRFYVGGFLPSISESEIGTYVNDRGPNVSKVTIFRNSRYNTATIRVNVLDDEECYLLEEHGFWPRGIICRPWVTRNQLRQGRQSNRKNNRTDYNDDNDYNDYHDNAPQWRETNNEFTRQYENNVGYNRYSALSSNID
jgi:hypothetical protein